MDHDADFRALAEKWAATRERVQREKTEPHCTSLCGSHPQRPASGASDVRRPHLHRR